jgi:hypothetical protein
VPRSSDVSQAHPSRGGRSARRHSPRRRCGGGAPLDARAATGRLAGRRAPSMFARGQAPPPGPAHAGASRRPHPPPPRGTRGAPSCTPEHSRQEPLAARAHAPAGAARRRGGLGDAACASPLGADDPAGGLPAGRLRAGWTRPRRRRPSPTRTRAVPPSVPVPPPRRWRRGGHPEGTTGPTGACSTWTQHRPSRPPQWGGDRARMPAGPPQRCGGSLGRRDVCSRDARWSTAAQAPGQRDGALEVWGSHARLAPTHGTQVRTRN